MEGSSIVRRFVEIVGEDLDTKSLAIYFDSVSIRVEQKDDGFYLTGDDFDQAESAEAAWRLAKNRVDLINGAARIKVQNYKDIRLGANVIGVDASGKEHKNGFLSARFEIRSGGHAKLETYQDGQLVEREPPQVILQDYIKLAETDPQVKRVLNLFINPDWINLYKILELVREDTSQQKLLERGWITKRELSLFGQTAQSTEAVGEVARHAAKKYKPPVSPMSLRTAQAIFRNLVTCWIEHKWRASHPGP